MASLTSAAATSSSGETKQSGNTVTSIEELVDGNPMTILNAFNNHIIEFFDDVVIIFPNNTDVFLARSSLIAMRKINPKLIIKMWKEYIFDKYNDEIMKGNIDFFIKKDYADDLKYTANSNTILEKISTLRDPINQMGTENTNKTIKYIQNLSKLSNIYYT